MQIEDANNVGIIYYVLVPMIVFGLAYAATEIWDWWRGE